MTKLRILQPTGFTPNSLGTAIIPVDCPDRKQIVTKLESFQKGKIGKREPIKDYTVETMRDGRTIRIAIYSQQLLETLRLYE